MKVRLLAGLLCVSLLALASTLKAQSSAQDFVYFGKELELSKLAGQEIDPLDKLITQILKLAPEEKLAPALENLTKRMAAGSVVAPKAMTLEALEATRSLLVAHNAQITSDAELKSLDSQLEFYKKAIENDVLTITVSSERAPHQPLDMGDAASTGNVGETFEPISASGFVLPDDVNIVHNLSVGNDMTIGGNLVINDTVTINGTLELPTGYVTTGGDRYINDFGATSFFAGVNAGNTAANNSGIGNTGIGYRALTAVTFGFGDTGIGANALPAVTMGFANTAIGSSALAATITANNNTAVGAAALFNSNTDNNTALGSNAGLNLITGSNNIYIGYNEVGSAAESNTIRIGANATLAATKCFIGGIVPAGPFANAVTIDPLTGQLGGIPSSRRYKENIQPLNSQERFMQLNPVSFTYKNDASKSTWYGLIAEEVEPVYPELAVYGKDGQIESVSYQKLDGIIIKELQALIERNNTFESTNTILSAKLESALERIKTLEAKLAALEN